jgi:hypothetical protein
MKYFAILVILAVTLTGCASLKHEDIIEDNPEVSKEAHAYFILYGLNGAFEDDWFLVGRSYRALLEYRYTYGSIEAAKLITGIGLTQCHKESRANLRKYSESFIKTSNSYIKSMKTAWSSLKGIDYDISRESLLFDYNCMAVKTEYGKQRTKEIIIGISDSVFDLGMKGNEEACNAFEFKYNSNRRRRTPTDNLAESCKAFNPKALSFLEDKKQEEKRRMADNKIREHQEELKKAKTIDAFNTLRLKEKKMGDRVCGFNNDFGYVDQIEGSKIKFLKIGTAPMEQGSFFTGNVSKFNFERVEEYKWIDAGHLASCNFQN